MQKMMLIAVVVLVLGCWTGFLPNAAQARDNATSCVRPAERFGRGLINILSAPLEVPAQLYIRASYQNDNSGNFFAVLGGFIEGIPMGLVYVPWRLTAGLYDLFTFPFKGCNQSIITPAYLTFSTDWLEQASRCSTDAE